MGDLSPAACHISANYTCPAEVVAVQHEFACISARVAETSAWLYGTEHYEPAIGLYDPKSPAVAERLKNLSQNIYHDMNLLEGNQEKTWEVVGREEVERSLGFPISKLQYTEHGENVDLGNVATWIRIPATLIYTVWSDVYQCEGFRTIRNLLVESTFGQASRFLGNEECCGDAKVISLPAARSTSRMMTEITPSSDAQIAPSGG